MSDLNHQNFDVAQSNQQPFPNTVAVGSDGILTPQTRLTFVSGTNTINFITPPTSGYAEVAVIFTDESPGGFDKDAAGSNLYRDWVCFPMQVYTLYYDPNTALWYLGAFTSND